MKIISTVTDQYIQTFSSFSSQFMTWGKSIFFTLLVFNFTWIAITYAAKGQTLAQTLGDFIRKYFGMFFFYTVMIYPKIPLSIFDTVLFMGKKLTKLPVDPSSIISQGIGIANRLILPAMTSSLITSGFGLIILSVSYLCVLFIFISIGLRLAYLLISTTALISLSPLFLSFSALQATQSIARQALDAILANCVKMLGIYLVVAGSSAAIKQLASSIPVKLIAFDPYFWILAAVWLLWILAMGLPPQLARIVLGSFSEARGTSAVALAVTTINHARNMGLSKPEVAKKVGSYLSGKKYYDFLKRHAGTPSKKTAAEGGKGKGNTHTSASENNTSGASQSPSSNQRKSRPKSTQPKTEGKTSTGKTESGETPNHQKPKRSKPRGPKKS